jgi:hypothetical protein
VQPAQAKVAGIGRVPGELVREDFVGRHRGIVEGEGG